MSSSQRGTRLIPQCLFSLTKREAADPRTFSLSQIYSGLCKSCARPLQECKNQQFNCYDPKSRTNQANKYAALRLEHHETKCLVQNGVYADQHGQHYDLASVAPSCKTSPKIVDDSLSHAFEIRKEIQVRAMEIFAEIN